MLAVWGTGAGAGGSRPWWLVQQPDWPEGRGARGVAGGDSARRLCLQHRPGLRNCTKLRCLTGADVDEAGARQRRTLHLFVNQF